MPERIVFHIDVNSAFLSWEAVYRLQELGETIDLREIPSAVGGDKEKRHGIILAKSVPAARLGIKTAETLADALKKCPTLTLVPPRHHLYSKKSKELMKLLSEYSEHLEKYSIDEAFLDMTDSVSLFGTPLAAAHQIKDRILDELGFTVNIGVSTNKLLAKMASDFQKPNLVHTLFPDEIAEKMWPLPVRELFFVGGATAKKLELLGIRTIGDLAHYDKDIIISHLGKHGRLIHEYANGIDQTPVQELPPDNKGYGNSTTIDHDVTDREEARAILLSLCETVGARLRSDRMTAGVISVSIKTHLLKTSSHQRVILTPTNVTSELYHYASELFDELWDGTPIRLLGVQTSKVTSDDCRQLNIFDMNQYAKQNKMELAVDKIRSRFGNDSIMRASFLKSDTPHMTGKMNKRKTPD